MVDQIKERAAELVQQYSSENENTFRRMVPIVLKKGLENINLEMFSDEVRTGILNAVAEELVKKGQGIGINVQHGRDGMTTALIREMAIAALAHSLNGEYWHSQKLMLSN